MSTPAEFQAFLRRHGLNGQRLAHLLGVSPSQSHKWVRGFAPIPREHAETLRRWEADGCPLFPYWDAYAWRKVGTRTEVTP